MQLMAASLQLMAAEPATPYVPTTAWFPAGPIEGERGAVKVR